SQRSARFCGILGLPDSKTLARQIGCQRLAKARLVIDEEKPDLRRVIHSVKLTPYPSSSLTAKTCKAKLNRKPPLGYFQYSSWGAVEQRDAFLKGSKELGAPPLEFTC